MKTDNKLYLKMKVGVFYENWNCGDGLRRYCGWRLFREKCA